jgi:hypothetical protein
MSCRIAFIASIEGSFVRVGRIVDLAQAWSFKRPK